MNHLIICREYPPAPGGGIGTYASHISRLLAESGETVHMIGQLWLGAEKEIEEKCGGRLIIHRVPLEDWTVFPGTLLPSPLIRSREARGLFESTFYPLAFSWQAGLLAEKLVQDEGIDIIEAQEYEAPLYFFQLRRALGAGPARRPPCIIHLHSPTELIVFHNDRDTAKPYFRESIRAESHSILAADALLCPSRYLASQVCTRFGLSEEAVRVIPYPMGKELRVERKDSAWRDGPICYMGRLERRKGLIEWIDAAVEVACEHSAVQFEFIGANVLGSYDIDGRELLDRLIPERLRARFHFRGARPHASLHRFLEGARMSVVPSRWENFPYTCIEAMTSGLPVLASREGGMAEMIRDGQSGWLSDTPCKKGLAQALRRALKASPEELAAMGREASLSIRALCSNEHVLKMHLGWRKKLCERNAQGSHFLMPNLPRPKTPYSNETVRVSDRQSDGGLAIVITCGRAEQSLSGCLQSIERQTQKPAAVVIVHGCVTNEDAAQALDRARAKGYRIVAGREECFTDMATGLKSALKVEPAPSGISFLCSSDRLEPEFVEKCQAVFRNCPSAGIVSVWSFDTGSKNETRMRLCPEFPHQLASNDAAPFSAVRAEALLESGGFRAITDRELALWDLFNGVMALGWAAVTIPELLGSHDLKPGLLRYTNSDWVHGRMRRSILERFSPTIGNEALNALLLCELSLRDEIFSLRRELEISRQMLFSSRFSMSDALGRFKRRILSRLPSRVARLISDRSSFILKDS